MLTKIKSLTKAGSAFFTLLVFACALFDATPVHAQTPSPLIISEFRLRGPNGANDEFIEIYNNSAGTFTVASGSGTGFAVAASGGVILCTIPNGTVIPNRGHYLCVNSTSYSLSSYAVGDATYTTDIAENTGIALFNNNTGGASFNLANRLDAVGSSNEANALYREGAGYAPFAPLAINYSLARRLPGGCTGSSGGVGDNCNTVTLIQITGAPTSVDPQDTNDNSADLIVMDPNGTPLSGHQRLGAPQPENLSSPIRSNLPGGSGLVAAALDPLVAIDAAPNQLRDFTSDPINNSTFGTLSVRRTFTNNTGAPITRLRFRVTDITTFPSIPGVSDLRPRTSGDMVVNVTGGGFVTVRGTTLDTPPAQTNGGGFNSTLSVGAVTPGSPLAPGASINVQFLLGVQQSGAERFEMDTPIGFIRPADTINGRLTNNNGVGLANVVVTLSGTLTRVAVTDALGNYSFTNLTPGGNYTVTPRSPYFAFTPLGASIASLTTNQVADFVAPVTAPPTIFPTLADDFESNARDPNKWNLGTLSQPPGAFDPAVTVVQQDGTLVITPRPNAEGEHFNGYVSVFASDLTNGSASVELKQAGSNGTTAAFAVGEDSENFYRFVVAGPNTSAAERIRLMLPEGPLTETLLFFQIRIAGVLTQESVPYDPAAHRFLRFRHDAPLNAINFETSPQIIAWTTRRSFGPLQKGVSALACELSAGTGSPQAAPGQVIFDNFQLTTNTLQLSVASRSVGEGDGAVVFNVVRRGALNTPALVRYEAVSRTASSRSDFLDAFGTLSFAPGVAEMTFTVLVTDDVLVEGAETFEVFISVPHGGGLDAPARTIVTINDNDVLTDAPNPIDSTAFYVSQQYADFLNRAPDAGGLAFWSGGIESCLEDAQCREVKRVDTSAAFFLSIEFQETGVLVYRMYKAAYGDINPPAVPVPVRLREFTEDAQRIGRGVQVGIGEWQAQLEKNKSDYASEFVARARFADAYPDMMSPADFVGALNTKTGGALSPDERAALVTGLQNGTLTRAKVLRAVAEDADFAAAEFRRAFVLMQYFGYLRRDPDDPDFLGNPDPNFLGYKFWLNKLDQFNGNYVEAEMVRAFISSIEYRQRFGR